MAQTSLAGCEGYGCDRPHGPTSLCLSCGSSYCDNCWVRQGPHQPGKVGLDGLPHEKGDKATVERLKSILEPLDDPKKLIELHLNDEDTTWFGVTPDGTANGSPIFEDHGRFAALMAETRSLNGAVRYPQLVSFIGQTSAGKSTLIKLLVSHMEHKLPFISASPFRSPVVGSAKNDKSPTSGDVHLYADPATAFGPLPMLYADCEGLEGGEVPPVATRSRALGKSSMKQQLRRNLFRGKSRTLAWAVSAETSGREFAVRHLYPRLLYTFSDVIVFVLRNPRTFESVALKLLLDWAATSLESSINQPTLPHAIIVLNATDMQVPQEEWDVSKATANLMSHVEDAVSKVPIFQEYARRWSLKGKAVKNMKDLILCYYSSINVVRIPTKGRYMLLDKQVGILHDEIVKGCNASYYAKEGARMLSNTDELNEYLQAGFDHFATKLYQPFNFVEVALRNNPIPRDFGDHILSLAAAIREKRNVTEGPKLFRCLSYMVASCILLDCVRQRRPGKIEELFDKFYVRTCKAALDHFCDKFWPCEFVKKGKACVNVKSSHNAKGHQNSKGRIISTGQYHSSFNPSAYSIRWISDMKKNLAALEKSSASKSSGVGIDGFRTVDIIHDAYQVHQERLSQFYLASPNVSAKEYFSLTTCLSCLMEVPQHPLPCGHVLCTACIKGYGLPNKRNSMLMEFCPLHAAETRGSQPWLLYFKPDFAGVRVLSLDGGGIRGIIELEVLRAIEDYIGGKIPIQAFFDLIVGTSTGGIIALGLGVKQWSISHCAVTFTKLCDQAFTSREFPKVPGLQQATTLRHGSKYKTTPLHWILEQTFGHEYLYGGQHKSHGSYATKVAVTSTTGTGQHPVILGNYSRQEETQPDYKFEFSYGTGLGLKIWEAAAATSAAPSFFKPFKCEANGRHYLDGALYHNNPVKVANHERRLLWPDIAENPPDIILSIGTGKNGLILDQEVKRETEPVKPSNQQRVTGIPHLSEGKEKKNTRKKKKLKKRSIPFKLLSGFFSVLTNRMDNILDAELAWAQFRTDVADQTRDSSWSKRYFRLNPDLGEDPPPLDAKQKLREVQLLAVNSLRTDSNKALVQKIAHQLVASSFYFVKEGLEEDGDSYICSGTILCRFDDNPNELRALGDFFRNQQMPDFQPFFSIKEKIDDVYEQKVVISQSITTAMMNRAEFRLDPFRIHVRSMLAPTMVSLSLLTGNERQPALYPISGFPRCFVIEDSQRASRLDRREELIKARRYGGLTIASDPNVNDSAVAESPVEKKISRYGQSVSVESRADTKTEIVSDPAFAGTKKEPVRRAESVPAANRKRLGGRMPLAKHGPMRVPTSMFTESLDDEEPRSLISLEKQEKEEIHIKALAFDIGLGMYEGDSDDDDDDGDEQSSA